MNKVTLQDFFFVPDEYGGKSKNSFPILSFFFFFSGRLQVCNTTAISKGKGNLEQWKECRRGLIILSCSE